MLLIEYDGHHHYSYPKKEDIGCEWNRIECDTFLLRIPYWIQLDNEMFLKFFGIAKDHSNDFPHGFIDKNTVLPARFTYDGFGRFMKEMGVLPLYIQQQIAESLLNKVKGCDFWKVAPDPYWLYCMEHKLIQSQKHLPQVIKNYKNIYGVV